MNNLIPEVNLNITSTPIQPSHRKLKAKWQPERDFMIEPGSPQVKELINLSGLKIEWC